MVNLKIKLLLLSILIPVLLFSWTSSNEGTLYIMDDLCALSDSISYNDSLLQYDVECDIFILENDTLMIEPGQIVEFIMLFQVGNTICYGMRIYGCLQAMGSELYPITLGDPEYDYYNGNHWNGIRFYDTSTDGESILQYCNITGVGDQIAFFAIYCYNSSPIIDHCNINHMWPPAMTGGGTGIYCAGQSYPFISYCTFEELLTTVAIWCGNEWDESLGLSNWANDYWGYQDTLNYPSPIVYNCNVMPSVSGFFSYNSDYERVILLGGFMDNCYLGIDTTQADMTLGEPVDTVGDGICTTTSTNWIPRYILIDGVVNPRETPEFTGINEYEIKILPTTTDFLILHQNYPNPFNPSTTINFSLLQPCGVELSIYNVKGQKIKQLVSEQLSASQHSVVWNGDDENSKNVGSGVYFYKLETDNELKIKKAIIVK